MALPRIALGDHESLYVQQVPEDTFSSSSVYCGKTKMELKIRWLDDSYRISRTPQSEFLVLLTACPKVPEACIALSSETHIDGVLHLGLN